jgi:hypothetical protein
VINGDEKMDIEKIRKAFEIMISKDNTIELNELGKSEIGERWKEKWDIISIAVLGDITICSETHYIYEDCPIEWFDLDSHN